MPDPFISEVKYLGGANEDFIEVAVDAGFDVTGLQVTVYQSNGNPRSISDLSDLTPTTVNGKDVYVLENGDATNFNGVAFHQGVSLTQDGTTYSFVSFDDTSSTITAQSGPAAGDTSVDVGQAPRGSSLETTDGGQTYFTQDTPDAGNVTCLVKGTWIRSVDGPVKVEDLKIGTQVLTFDGEAKPLRRIFAQSVDAETLASEPKMSPIRITAGALGAGLPSEDLLVSRQHRMVVSSQISGRMMAQEDVLVPALRLTALPGIFADETLSTVTYYHLLFDAHEVIFANDAPTESFFLGAEALSALPPDALTELREIFPDLTLPMQIKDSKLPIPNARVQTALVNRHAKSGKGLLSKQAL